MFSGRLELLRRNIGVRLQPALCADLHGGQRGPAGLAYYLLAAAVGGKTGKCWMRASRRRRWFEVGGVVALRSWVYNQPIELQNSMLVHLVNPRAPGRAPGHQRPRGLDRAARRIPAGMAWPKRPTCAFRKTAERDHPRAAGASRRRILQIGHITNSRAAS